MTQIDAGSDHACARFSDGSLRCWGDNQQGELGAAVSGGAPALVTAVSNAIEVRAYGYSSCAVLPQGSVSCWGQRQEHGVFAGGAGIEPFVIEGAEDILTLGYLTALRVDGTVVWWGTRYGFDHQAVAQPIEGLVDVVALAKQACAIVADGTVQCWGSNECGELGDGTEADRLDPGVVTGLTDVVHLSGECQTRCAVRADGTIWCWGSNNPSGKLGDGTTTNRPLAKAVLNVTEAIRVAVGCSHVCALTGGGAIYCWGNNGLGQLGDGTLKSRSTVGAPVFDIRDAIDVTASGWVTCAIRADHSVWCWGSSPGRSSVPVRVDL